MKPWLVMLAAMPLIAPAYADNLGRLFHTPEQRALLDQVRRGTPAGTLTPDGGVDSAPGVMLNGVVTRSDGKRSTWVNGRMTNDANGARNSVRMQVPSGSVQLKVGQSIDPGSGQTIEAYRRAPPPAPKAEPAPAPKPAAKKPQPAEARDDDATPADEAR